MDTLRPGVYVIRTQSAETLTQHWLRLWLNNKHNGQFNACLWLTNQPATEIQNFLSPFLKGPKRNTRGLDVISTRPTLKQGRAGTDIRGLCRALDTHMLLSPSLVVIERPDLWINCERISLVESSPLRQMMLLQRWAAFHKAVVVLPLVGRLTSWAAFADGLGQLEAQSTRLVHSWWTTQWGKTSELWGDLPDRRAAQGSRFGIRLSKAEHLPFLARSVYQLRFQRAEPCEISVVSRHFLSEAENTMLLRLGANAVITDEKAWQLAQGESTDGIEWLADHAHEQTEPIGSHFAQDLHEALTPGQLVLLSSRDFAVNCLEVIAQAERWGLCCTITRLSLLNHVTASQAARLLNPLETRASALATLDGVYLFRVWSGQPDSDSLGDWLSGCFQDDRSTLFGGLVHYHDAHAQIELLRAISREREALSSIDLEPKDLGERTSLIDVWRDDPARGRLRRPWMRRLEKLLQMERQS